MPPRIAKLLAIIVALALIGGAFWYRNRDSGDSSGGSGPVTNGSADKPRVVCVRELAAICNRLAQDMPIDLTTSSAGETASALAKADSSELPFDAWITLDPWPQMVDSTRSAAGLDRLFTVDSVGVASQGIGAVMNSERFAALQQVCPDLDWACVAEKAGKPWSQVAPATPAAANWGQFKVGIGDLDSALGRLVLGQLAASVAAVNDLGTDPGVGEFAPFLNTLGAPIDSADQLGTEDMLTRLVTRPGSYSLVAATGAEVVRTAASQQGDQQSLDVIALGPSVRADVVVAPIGDSAAAREVVSLFSGKTASDAFAGEGWQPGNPDGSNGLPAPDVLQALRQRIS